MNLRYADTGAPPVCDCSCHRCCVPLDGWCEDCEDHPWHAPVKETPVEVR